MKKTQQKFILEHILEHGEVSRNFALGHFISRLSAVIQDLEVAGYTFATFRKDGDYYYRLMSEPSKPPIVRYEPIFDPTGRVVAMKEVC